MSQIVTKGRSACPNTAVDTGIHLKSKQWCMLMAGKDGKMFVTRSFNITTKTTEQHLIACSDKSVAYVTNNKRLCSTFCTIEDNY